MNNVTAPRFAVKVVGGEIHAYTPFILKDTCKSIPGAKWNAQIKAWTYPATATAADTINRRLPPHIARDAAFLALVDDSRQAKARDLAVKQGVNLPPIPVTKLAAWKHQQQAYWFAENKSAAMLAMYMGTGKTKVTIDRLQNDGAKRVLILCPKAVVTVWPAEFAKHCAVPYEIFPLTKGTVAVRAAQVRALLSEDVPNMRIFVLNYESAWPEAMARTLLGAEWDYVICDESHRIKAPNGVASKFVAKLGERARKRLALTGTPMPHSPMDAYAQYRFLDPSIFGRSFHVFKHTYASWGGYGGHELLGYKNEDDLNARFYSIAYRADKSVLDLPPFMHIERTFALEGKAATMYRELENDFITWVQDGDEVTVSNALVKLLRLQQLTSGYLPVDAGDGVTTRIHEQKRELLEDVLEDIDLSEPVVIFARFRSDLDEIHKAAKALGRASYELSGRINQYAAWRDHTSIAREGRGAILASQIQSGKEGIDLTAARYCIYYSLGFSLGDYDQSLARVHRPGQERETFYYHLIAESTVDRKVYDALANRRAVVESMLEEWQQ